MKGITEQKEVVSFFLSHFKGFLHGIAGALRICTHGRDLTVLVLQFNAVKMASARRSMLHGHEQLYSN